MRDPDRIDEVLAELGAVWRADPDMRLTQLVFNAASLGLRDTEAPLGSIPPRFYNCEEPFVLDGLAQMRKS